MGGFCDKELFSLLKSVALDTFAGNTECVIYIWVSEDIHVQKAQSMAVLTPEPHCSQNAGWAIKYLGCP